MADQCSSCDYARPRVYGSKTVIECRVIDPKAFAGGQKGQWPEVQADDWCGEYVPPGWNDPANYYANGLVLNTTTKTKILEVEADYNLRLMRGNASNTSTNKGVLIKFFDGNTTKMIGALTLKMSDTTAGEWDPQIICGSGSCWAQIDSAGFDVYIFLAGKRGRKHEVITAEA